MIPAHVRYSEGLRTWRGNRIVAQRAFLRQIKEMDSGRAWDRMYDLTHYEERYLTAWKRMHR